MFSRSMSVARCGVAIGVTLTLGMASTAHATSIFDAAGDFSTTLNPNGAWSYGEAPTLGEVSARC